MVDDINRILRRKKSPIRFTYQDRWNRYKSIKMFEIYCKHYNLETYEQIARCWNGGPYGINKPATTVYWEKVKNQIKTATCDKPPEIKQKKLTTLSIPNRSPM